MRKRGNSEAKCRERCAKRSWRHHKQSEANGKWTYECALPFGRLLCHGAFPLYWRRRILFFVIVILRRRSSGFALGLVVVSGAVVVLLMHCCLVIVERFIVGKILFCLDSPRLGEAELDFLLADVTETILITCGDRN